jgi:hypothetical protein
MTDTNFCDVTPCSPVEVEVYKRFGGLHYLDLQFRRIGQTRNQQESSGKYNSALRNVGGHLPDDTALHPRKQYFSHSSKWGPQTQIVLY